MSKTLESLFNLPPAASVKPTADADPTPADVAQTVEDTQTALTAVNDAIDKIDAALPTVKDLTASDTELDAIADLATNSFKDLMDYGMNVDPRVSGTIFQSASAVLGHALTAKMAKMDKKLKMVDLQLKKARLDQAEKSKEGDGSNGVIDGKGTLLDRNELLRAILADASKKDK